MDPLTHSLMGAALADCGFRNGRLGPGATAFAMIVAAAPDADLIAALFDPVQGWLLHRGWTHSLPTAAVAGPILGYLGYRLSGRAGSWARWSVLAFLALVSHSLLDSFTAWGTMLWQPFSDARTHWDTAPILDVFIASVLLASFAANRLLRRERREIPDDPFLPEVVHAHPDRAGKAGRAAALALALVVCYLGVGSLQSRQALLEAERALEAEGVAAAEIRALPVMFTYLAWEVSARDSGGAVWKALYSTLAPKPLRFSEIRSSGEAGAAGREALSSRSGRLFAGLTGGMFTVESKRSGDGWETLLIDRRTSSLADPGRFRFALELGQDASGLVVSEKAVRRLGIDVESELLLLWNLTVHGRPDADG